MSGANLLTVGRGDSSTNDSRRFTGSDLRIRTRTRIGCVMARPARGISFPDTNGTGATTRRLRISVGRLAELVMDAVQARFPEHASPEAQAARRNIDALLRHFHETGTRRNGRLVDGEAWLIAAIREHALFPFGGIVVRLLATRERISLPPTKPATRLSCLDAPPPPVPRRPRELANALAPLLRWAMDLRFVDPYFDANVEAFFEPMREFCGPLKIVAASAVFEFRFTSPLVAGTLTNRPEFTVTASQKTHWQPLDLGVRTSYQAHSFAGRHASGHCLG